MDVNFPDPFVRTTLTTLKTVSKPTNHNTLLSSRKRKISLVICQSTGLFSAMKRSLLLFAKTFDLIIIGIILEKAALHISGFM